MVQTLKNNVISYSMLTQILEKSSWITNLIKKIRSIAIKGVINAILYAIVLLLLSSVTMCLMYFALVVAASTPY
jgi:hypothetical protein